MKVNTAYMFRKHGILSRVWTIATDSGGAWFGAKLIDRDGNVLATDQGEDKKVVLDRLFREYAEEHNLDVAPVTERDMLEKQVEALTAQNESLLERLDRMEKMMTKPAKAKVEKKD
jgi:hypothetical protein